MMHTVLLLRAMTMLWVASPGTRDTAPPACPDAGAPTRFAWRSGFWLNLHNFLHHTAKERRGIHNDSPAAMAVVFDDTIGLRIPSPGERAAWDAALTYYMTDPLTQGLMDGVVQQVNERLSGAADDGELEDVAIDPGLRRVLVGVAPIYRAVWWPVHDQRNREWIASMRRLLIGREPCLAQVVSRDLAAPWPNTPVVVDVSVYATWFGAYSTHHPTHITLSSNARGNQGTLGVETLFHEAGHGMTALVDSALKAGANAAHRALPDPLPHLALFYTVGDAVTRDFPAHVPYARVFRLWDQSDAARRYRSILAREWQPYLDGRRTFADAISRIVRALPLQTTARSAATGSR